MNKSTVVQLDGLLSDDFIAEVGVVSSPRGLRRAIYKSDRVAVLRRAISCGSITETDIRQFTERLMKDFSRGEKFPHELALAALAIALENRRTEFAEEYLLDLARLNIVEMSLAPGVARDSVRHWRQLPRTRVRRIAPTWGARKPNPSQSQTIRLVFEVCMQVNNRSIRRRLSDATA